MDIILSRIMKKVSVICIAVVTILLSKVAKLYYFVLMFLLLLDLFFRCFSCISYIVLYDVKM